MSENLFKNHEKASHYANNLTDAQKSALNRIKNTIENNLKESDFSGTKLDLENKPVPNGRGGYFNHIKEMRQSYIALAKSVKSLEGSLKNPFLSPSEKQIIVAALDIAYENIDKIEDLFKGYGTGYML